MVARSCIALGRLTLVLVLTWLLAPVDGGSLRGGEERESLRLPPKKAVRTATFINPMVKDLPIDYCLEYMELNGPERRGIDCGQPVATRFCKDKGYAQTTGYICMYYSHGATYVLGMDDVNPPSDKTLGLGFHTFFSNISCSDATN